MGKVSARTALAGASVAVDDLLPIVDTSATTAGSKKITLEEFHKTFPVIVSAEMTGSGAAATDELPFFDAGVPKTITVAELFAAWPAAITTEITGDAVAGTDEFLLSDAGVPKTISMDEVISALALLGFALADIPEYADQAAAAAALTGTGKLFRFATTGALGVTIT